MAKEYTGKSAKKARLAALITRTTSLALLVAASHSLAAESVSRPSPLLPQSIPDAQSIPAAGTALEPWLSPLMTPTDGEHEFRLSVRDSLQFSVNLSDDASAISPSGEFAGTTGTWSPRDGVSLKAGYGQHSFGSSPTQIGCLAGTSNFLDCISSRAAGSDASIQTYTVGASWQATERVSLSVDYYNQSQEAMVSDALDATRASNRLPGIARTQALDVSLSCDIDAGRLGDLEVGLQLSRIVKDGELPSSNPLTDPYDQAVLGLGWQRGDFSGDLTSRYMDWLGDDDAQAEAWTTFDINFAWRTPWNASLSVGARNVLNNPAPNSTALVGDSQIEDMLGRVPYVRYRQDL